MVTTNDGCNLSDVIVIITITNSKAVADGPVGQVLAAPLLFFQDENESPFYRNQVINKSARVIIGLIACYITRYSRKRI